MPSKVFKIMIVDDSPNETSEIRRRLNESFPIGLEMLEVSTLDQARVTAAGSPDIAGVVLDLDATPYQGVEALERLQMLRRDLPIVCIAKEYTATLKLACLARRAADLVSKDNLDRLPEVLARTIADNYGTESRRSTDHVHSRLDSIYELVVGCAKASQVAELQEASKRMFDRLEAHDAHLEALSSRVGDWPDPHTSGGKMGSMGEVVRRHERERKTAWTLVLACVAAAVAALVTNVFKS